MRSRARRTFELLRKQREKLPESSVDSANRLLNFETQLDDRFQQLREQKIAAVRMRCHGDLHLGQVLFTGKDFVIIDFEGEPDRPISERRIKTSPLRDIAGMLRSYHYASHAAQYGQAPGTIVQREPFEGLDRWMHIWYLWNSATFLNSYLNGVRDAAILPDDPEQLRILLEAYVLDKAVYELGYELNNRPEWVRIPIEGMLHLIAS
jgi:maltose alpha-D-glucosyltransferase/alpha-amylase